MRRGTTILHLIDKFFVEKIYDRARTVEKKMDQNNFIARYTLQTVLYLFVLFAITLSFAIFLFKSEFAICIILYICAIGMFLLMICYISYRCYVNDEGITSVHLGIIKKHISWKDIEKVDSFTHERMDRAFSRELIFRNKQNKIIFTCTYELAGFNLVLEKIKEHGIVIKRKYK